jgi:hypothetical protein
MFALMLITGMFSAGVAVGYAIRDMKSRRRRRKFKQSVARSEGRA